MVSKLAAPLANKKLIKSSKAKKRRRGSAIEAQRRLNSILDLLSRGFTKKDIMIFEDISEDSYDYYIHKINEMYLDRYKNRTEEQIGLSLGLAQQRLDRIIDFCEDMLDDENQYPFARLKAAELYITVITETAKLQVSAKKVLQHYREMDKVRATYNNFVKLPRDPMEYFIDESKNSPINDNTNFEQNISGTTQLEVDPEAVF